MWWLWLGAALGLVVAIVNFFSSGYGTTRRVSRSPDDRIRQIVKQSLQIASDTKRKATAESRLKVAEDALNGLLMETAEDRRNRQAIKSLRDTLDSRFPRAGKRRTGKN